MKKHHMKYQNFQNWHINSTTNLDFSFMFHPSKDRGLYGLLQGFLREIMPQKPTTRFLTFKTDN